MHRGVGSFSIAAFVVALVAVMVPGGTGPAQADGQLPNIVPLPASDVHVGRDDSGTGLALRFSSWMANHGQHHFDIVGVPNAQFPVTADALQCTEWAGPRVCSARQEIGSLEYHDAHQHWHFQNFARYELRRASDGELVSLADKVSFCMMDSAPVRPTRTPETLLAHPLYYGCDLGTQGISAGWADIYSAGLPGQQLSIAGLPDGDYDLVTVADPAGLILETDDSDNASVRRVRLSNRGTKATVIG